MAAQIEVLEERLKSFLCQLQAESGILDRIIYKNKNQHRRSSYFQYLLKVRRDLKLLHLIHMEELLDSCFNVFTGKKAKQKAHLLESLKRRKSDSGKFNFMERLRGAARLLSEMVEPMLKAATEISTLLARSFFMGFSVMVLALLARLRVLSQQMLLDVVSVFNEVSSLAQQKQSIKITQDGIEVFREYYPTMEEEVMFLECVWKKDKFVLVETSGKSKTLQQHGSSETVQTLGTSVKYHSIDAFLEDRENNDMDEAQMPSAPEDGSENVLQSNSIVPLEDSSLAYSMTSPLSSSAKPNYMSKKSVAFIAVKKTAPSATDAADVSQTNDSSKGKTHDDEHNNLFSLFTEDETKSSIF